MSFKEIKTILESFEVCGAGQESLKHSVIAKSKDEFQQLNVGFNQMTNQIHQLVNEKRKIWGEKRLVNSLTKALPLPAVKRLKTLQTTVSAFRGAALLNDDVSLVTVKFRN